MIIVKLINLKDAKWRKMRPIGKNEIKKWEN